MKRAAAFAALAVGITLLAAWIFSVMFRSPEAHRAILLSAAVAIVVQLVGFAIAALSVPSNPIAGWGAGVVLRILTVAVYGLLAVRAIGLPAAPALLSIATFLFLTTLVEPLFLKP